jgi:hypothetical protein
VSVTCHSFQQKQGGGIPRIIHIDPIAGIEFHTAVRTILSDSSRLIKAKTRRIRRVLKALTEVPMNAQLLITNTPSKINQLSVSNIHPRYVNWRMKSIVKTIRMARSHVSSCRDNTGFIVTKSNVMTPIRIALTRMSAFTLKCNVDAVVSHVHPRGMQRSTIVQSTRTHTLKPSTVYQRSTPIPALPPISATIATIPHFPCNRSRRTILVLVIEITFRYED